MGNSRKATCRIGAMSFLRSLYVIPLIPPTHKIDDYDKERVKGKFYELELQKVSKVNDVYKVESVLKTMKRKGRKEYLVK